MKKEQHSWSDDDNLIAYCLYRFGDGDLTVRKKELGDILGMGLGSLRRRAHITESFGFQ